MMTGCSKDEIETTVNNENTDSDTTQRTEWTGELRHATSSTSIDDNTIVVSWNDTATVEVAYNIYNKVWADIRDGHVTLLASADVDEDLTYILQGNSSDGSLYMDGQYKATFCLNGLTLTNPDSAAINIRDGKRIALYLVEETENTLTDGSGGEQKACFMVKGHTEVSGEGVLNINGNTGHAFWGKEYVQLKATTGTINIKKAVGDGMNVNQYFQMNGGVAIAFGSSGAETGIDIDERHSLSISGGYLFGIGGRVDSNLSNCSQAYGYTSRSASFSGNYIVVGTTTSQLWAVKLPTTSYSGILIASSPEMSSGTTYTISTASSIGGSEVNGFVEAPNASNPTQKTTIKATK